MGEVLGLRHFICAVGGQTFDLGISFGSYEMTVEEGRMIGFAFHSTPSLDKIKKAGFRSKMEQNGIHLFYNHADHGVS